MKFMLKLQLSDITAIHVKSEFSMLSSRKVQQLITEKLFGANLFNG